MQIDPNLFPTTLDVLHLGLMGLVVILLILFVILLTFSTMALLRRRQPLQVIVERVPAEMNRSPIAGPVRVVIDRVPPELVPVPAPPQIIEVAKPVPVAAPKPVEPSKPERVEPVIVKEATPDAALQLLGLLQKEARFLDFVQENIAGFDDADIGAAARVVHEGCRKVLKQHFELEPIRKESENTRITLPKGFDAASVRPTGNIVGQPPFTGTLIHRGWRAAQVKLPRIAEGHDVSILAQAEVEL